MNRAVFQGALASAAVVAGWWKGGWQGLALAASVIVFALLLQFTRAMRALRDAARRPVGTVGSVATLQRGLQHGMSLHEVIALTGSLGRRVGTAATEDWLWCDDQGNSLVVSLRRGRVVRWSLASDTAATAAPEDSQGAR